MKLETATRLHDAANACKEIQSLVAGLDEEAFLRDRYLVMPSFIPGPTRGRPLPATVQLETTL
jgi:hypothetical protein